MPRVTYSHRLEALTLKPLSDYDKGFVESLSTYYKCKRSMTAGRAAAVKRLEVCYSDENLAKAAADPINDRLKAIAARVPKGTWDAGFIESVASQAKRGRSLSDKQYQILTKIEERHTDAAIKQASEWKVQYTSDENLQEKAKIVSSYYSQTGFYSDLAHNLLYVDGFIPTEKQYKSITTNKYATKILEAWYSDPKYSVGSYVLVRDTAPGMVRGSAKNAPCVILKTNAMYPRCAGKGTKIYQVLPFGSPSPFVVEERYIKLARKLGIAQ